VTISLGTRLGPYEVTAKLGEGGMGEVYQAKDFHLGRNVALKVLPEGFTQDPERLARFEREAKLLAQLNHPNIAQIHGLEIQGETRALVMELVDGPTLAERLELGPFPFNESLSVSLQIAHALEEAHEKGIVHRDLKPQNIKASIEGKVKVLDFGLAKAMDPAGSASGGGGSASQIAQSPTLTLGGTAMGVILGTAAYMAPEQAKGLPVDKRADIWAFGVVVYEMLAGGRLFSGDSVPETLAGVLRNEIDFGLLPAGTPPAMRRLLRRCLERNPKNRLHDIADARIVLEEMAAGRADETPTIVTAAPAAQSVSPRSLAARFVPWVAGVAIGAAAIALVDRTLLRPEPYVPPSLVSLTYSGRDSVPAASPDGKTIAFTSTRDGRSRIWLKQLSTGEEVALTSGPNDAIPTFAPDGNTLLFLRGVSPPFSLQRVSSVGGEPRRIADGVSSFAAWSPDGRRIALTRSSTVSGVPDILAILSADGGEERELVRLTDVNLYMLRWSPDGRAIGSWAQLRTNFAAQQSILEFDVESGSRRTIYQPAGGVLLNGWAWTGDDAILVSESVTQSGRGGSRLLRIHRRSGAVTPLLSLRQPSSALDVLGAGRVVIDQFAPTQNLAEVSLAPGARPSTGSGGSEPWHRLTRGANVDRQPHYSPDGRRVVFNSDRSGNLDLWELELASGGVRPLTVSAADDWDPAYTPDGRQLIWSSNRGGNYEVWIAAADGTGARQLTRDGVDAENPTMTPDGQWVVYVSANPEHNGVWKIRADGTGAELLVPGTITIPDLSPDGRWVSYVDLDRNRLCVVTLADGAKIAEIALPTNIYSILQVGRSRWLPGTTTLVWLETEPGSNSTRLSAQQIAPGRDTRDTRRILVEGAADDTPESFAISPDGRTLLISIAQPRSELLLVEGLPGVTR
jgi:serine/threonine protein kinase